MNLNRTTTTRKKKRAGAIRERDRGDARRSGSSPASLSEVRFKNAQKVRFWRFVVVFVFDAATAHERAVLDCVSIA
jgi:hypothetical protein